MAILIAQHKSSYPSGTGGNLSFTSSTVSGNAVIVCASGRNTGGAWSFSVTDNKGNTYSLAGTLGSSQDHECIFYCKSITGGATHQITVTASASADTAFSIMEVSGLDTSSQPDGTPIVDAAGSSTALSVGTITTSVNDSLLVCCTGQHTTGWTSLTGTNSFAKTDEQVTASFASLTRIVTSTGTYTATGTFSPSIAWTASFAAFKGASSGGGGTFQPAWAANSNIVLGGCFVH